MDGALVGFNEDLLDDPSALNTDNYGNGWLFSMQTESPLLTPQQYLDELSDGWEKAQRTIKGQVNEG